MYLRSALLTDLPVLSNIAYLAFQNSTMYNHFSPLHSRYPVQFRKFLRDELWLRIISPRQVVIVAEMDDDDYNSMGASILENTRVKETSETESNKKVIVGYACWIFRADRVVPERWNCDTLLRSKSGLDCVSGFLPGADTFTAAFSTSIKESDVPTVNVPDAMLTYS